MLEYCKKFWRLDFIQIDEIGSHKIKDKVPIKKAYNHIN